MNIKIFTAIAACIAAASGLTQKEDETVTDILTILKRGTSIYPLEDLMHTLSVSLGFRHSARRLNRYVPLSKSAYSTVYDMLISVDTNGKHTTEQHAKLRQLIDIIGDKILNINAKDVNFRTLIVQEEVDDQVTDEAEPTDTIIENHSTRS
ncbi:hypothetical protein IWW36_001868 [Coemansia brasiliensis]|uniref:Uncharacterized protein n=1 Tax=Coemansia brasiliensis TaxID=2650707 RepID=A0A9W8IAR9_9FUNG|nr:hypothetical protein IWW36_001868 [Coemansia brasiliensis]